jgi:hypothetical protein
VLSRWKEYFEKHLNDSSEEELQTNQAHQRENIVIVDLPSSDKIVEPIKYLKENKTAAELLKSGGPSLVNALNGMFQQVWIGDTLPESWTEKQRIQHHNLSSL